MVSTMITASMKEELGFDPKLDDKTVIQLWKKRIRRVCKPCWELKYCPYGPLVEDFPLPEIPRDKAIEHNEYMKKALTEGVFDVERTENNKKLFTREQVEAQIESFNPLEYPEKPLPRLLKESFCTVFGHMCPVYFVAEPFTETKEQRQMTTVIPREVMLKVVRRDNSQCQKCGRILLDSQIEFDHIIPVSRGGPTSVENLRVTCFDCNRKKSAKIEILDDV